MWWLYRCAPLAARVLRCRRGGRALAATEAVEARPADLTTDIDADGAVADGADVELGALDVGLELLGEEVAQLLDGEPLDVEGAQAGKVDGAVGPNREGAAQFGDVQQLDLEAVAGAEDVACLLYTSPSPRDLSTSRMPSSA